MLPPQVEMRWFYIAMGASSIQAFTMTVALCATAFVLRASHRLSTRKCLIVIALALITFGTAYVATELARDRAFHTLLPGSRAGFM